MKKVMRFIKRRICPIMLALVIVFFSVVEVQASPAPVLPPTFEVIPGGGSISYFDVSQAIFGATGFDIRMVEEDGTPKSFEKELWDEMVDLFDIWAVENFGTSDFEEIDAELRGVIVDAVDGTISMSKKLFEALQQYASDAFDNIYNSISPDDSDDYVSSDGGLTGTYIHDITGQWTWGADEVVIPAGYHFVLGSFYEDNSSVKKYFLKYYDPSSYIGWYFTSGGYLFLRKPDLTNEWSYDCIFLDTFRQYTSLHYNNVTILATNGVQIDPSTGEPVPNLPRFPVEHITFDPESVPVPWDEVAPIEDPDTIKIPVPHKETDPDPEEVPDPDPIDPDPPIDPVPDPDPTDPVPPPEDDEDIVTPEEIGTLPDTAAAAGDITKLFPFCIPFDLVALIKGMKAQEKAPVWHFKYYFKDINYTFEFTVDMTDYEKYIKIFRAGIVIFWIIALMFLTIRYSSGIAKD